MHNYHTFTSTCIFLAVVDNQLHNARLSNLKNDDEPHVTPSDAACLEYFR